MLSFENEDSVMEETSALILSKKFRVFQQRTSDFFLFDAVSELSPESGIDVVEYYNSAQRD